MKKQKTSEKTYRRLSDATKDIQKGNCEHETPQTCIHCNELIINPEGFEKVKRGWAIYKSVRSDYYHDKCWDDALIEAHKRETPDNKDFLSYFRLDQNFKITDVREIYKKAENCEIELAKRLKSWIQEHSRKTVGSDFLEDLLDSEGVREYVRYWEVSLDREGARENIWANVIPSRDRHKYFSYRTLLLTEERKKFFRERGKQDPSSVLYLRKVQNQNELRIGIFEVYWVPAGMGVCPEFEKFQDLVSVFYETE